MTPTITIPHGFSKTPREFWMETGRSVDHAWRAWNEESVRLGRKTLSRTAFRKAVSEG